MFFRLLFFSIAILFFAFMAFVVREEQQRQEKINVALITVESLRNDMVTLENCPNLLDSAKSGYRFTNYRANSGWTGTNIVSLLSGLTPFESGVHTRGQSVAPELKLPLEQLVDSGYSVVGLQPFMAMDIYQNLGVSIDSFSPDPLVWLARQKLNSSPFFLWYHYVHTHLPYTGSSESVRSTLDPQLAKITTATAVHADEATYQPEDVELIHTLQQRNILDFDTWFKSLYQLYRTGGFQNNTILIVTADHGDEHGERGMVGHASTTLEGHLHEEIVHVPFFIWLPEKLRPENPDLEVAASHSDVMPSLMQLLKITPAQEFKGTTFLSNQNSIADEKTWTGMTSSGGFAEPDPASIRYYEYSLASGSWKLRLRQYAGSDREELFLYDLGADPGENDNLATVLPEQAMAMREKLIPLISTKISRPIHLVEDSTSADGIRPEWIHPSGSKKVSYESLDGKFFLEWSGESSRSYLLEYQAGHGTKVIQGTLDVEGNRKDFGKISQRYWNTWIVPNSPFKLRVKEAGGSFGPWLQLEALP